MSANSNPAPASSLGAIEDWINIDVIQKLAHHTSAVIAALVLFWFVGFMVRKLMHDGIFKHAVLLVDEFVLLCLFVYFAYELFVYL
ncbi:MAG TPA: hypothetical protein VKS22_09630 [Candidatus Binataceae bacterium]|nr:hypothetical protein [Candidatus Binataceae bacterium]